VGCSRRTATRSFRAAREALATGHGVYKIRGDQRTEATFCFRHPTQGDRADREVKFLCVEGEWRAEG
jgi:hypothetical protein